MAQYRINRFKVLLATWLLLLDCSLRIPVWSRNCVLRVKQTVVLISRQVFVGGTQVLKLTYQQRNRLYSESLSVPPRFLLPSLFTVFASSIRSYTSSGFGCTLRDVFPLCCNSTFIYPGLIGPVADWSHSESETKYTWMCHFSVLTTEWEGKAKDCVLQV